MPELSAVLPRPLVFYDGGCPLCSREIAHYRRVSGASQIEWIDVTTDQETLSRHGLDYSSAMSRFHVLDRYGNWQTGAYGFAELWSHLSGYRWMSRIVRSLGLVPLLDRIYSVFARRRLTQRCKDGSCELPNTESRTTSESNSMEKTNG